MTTDTPATPVEPQEGAQLEGDLDSQGEGRSSLFASPVSRRAALAGTALGAVGLLAACSSGSTGASSTSSAAAPNSSAPSGAGSSSGGAGGNAIAKVSDVPVGGGTLVKTSETQWLLAQPEAGKIVCHSGICTHQGCPLATVQGQNAICNCHGSEFNIVTGAVVEPPAQVPLPSQSVTVSGNDIILG